MFEKSVLAVFSLCISLGVILLVPTAAQSCTINWTGQAGDGNWVTPRNWMPEGVPGQGDDVCIPRNGSVLLNASSAIQSLNSDGDLSVGQFGSLTVDAPSMINGTFALTGSLGGTGSVTFGGQFNCFRGPIEGSGTVTLAGQMRIAGNGCGIIARTFENNGTVTMTESFLGLQRGAIFNNRGTFDIQNVGRIALVPDGPQPAFNNQGTFRRSISTGVATIEVPFTSSGTLSVDTGQLWMYRDGTYTGPISVAANATWDLKDGVHSLRSTPIAGPGTVAVSGATLQIATGVTATIDAPFRFRDGTITGGGELNLNGGCLWSGGIMTTPDDIAPGRTIVRGTMTLTFGSLQHRDLVNRGVITMVDSPPPFLGMTRALLINENQFDIGDGVRIDGAGSSIQNRGRMDKVGGAVATIYVSLENDTTGRLYVQAGRLALIGPGYSANHQGLANVEALSTLELGNGVHTVLSGGRFTGPGTLVFSSGTFDFQSNATIGTDFFRMNDGELKGAGQITITGMFTWAAGRMTGTDGTQVTNANGGMDLIGSGGSLFTRTLNLNSTTVPARMMGSGQLSLNSDAVLVNGPGATFDIQNDQRISGDTRTGGVLNHGIFRRSTSSGVARVEVPFTHRGEADGDRVNVDTGTLVLSGGSMFEPSRGTFEIASAATLQFERSGHYHLASQLRGGGTVLLSSGTLATTDDPGSYLIFDFYLTSFTFTGGQLSGPGDIIIQAPLVWTGGQMVGPGLTRVLRTTEVRGGVILDGRTLRNHSNARLAGAITMRHGAQLLNGSPRSPGGGEFAIFDIQNDQGIFVDFDVGDSQVINYDTFLRSTSSGVAVVQIPFFNAGTVAAQSGTLHFHNSADSSGIIGVNGGALAFNLGLNNTGEVNGDGPLTGNLTNAGTLWPGSAKSTGAIGITGALTQTAAGLVNIKISGATPGSEYDQVNLTGAANLDGALNISLLGGFRPVPGDTFRILSYGSRTGTFSTITGLDLGKGLSFEPDISDTAVTLTVVGPQPKVAEREKAIAPNSQTNENGNEHSVEGEGGGGPMSRTPRFAYVSNAASKDIWGYTVDAPTGALKPMESSPFVTGAALSGIAIEPTGHFLYGTSTLPKGMVHGFAIDAQTGELTPIDGSPFAAGESPRALAVDPSGRFLYVGNSGSRNISAYAIDSNRGVLKPMPGSPFSSGDSSAIATDPAGRFLYATSAMSDNVDAFTIDSGTGTLKPVPGSPFPSGTGPLSAAVEPSGQFVYVLNAKSETISAYKLDVATGSLAEIDSSPFASGTRPLSLVVEPSGQFLYVASSVSNHVAVYRIAVETGALTPLPESLFSVGDEPRSLHVDPTGQFVYAVNPRSDNVLGFALDPTSGALVLMAGAPFSTGSAPSSVTTTNGSCLVCPVRMPLR